MADGKQITPEQREVELVPHNPEWSHLADEEAKRIMEQLSIPVIGIYHIGSTSVPGIKAKPILDFVIEVEILDDFIQSAEVLEELNYVSKGEYGIPGRQFFTKDTDGERSHHLHVFQQGHPDIERHLVFRDFLRANPGAAHEYEIIKEKLAKRFPKESSSYTEAKSDFILSMDEVARYWLEKDGFKNEPPDSGS
jgi:GrpB-like predicted nucleotidyltransferase (UPF0157 family)